MDITRESLETRTAKALREVAKSVGVKCSVKELGGWRTLRKDELINAIMETQGIKHHVTIGGDGTTSVTYVINGVPTTVTDENEDFDRIVGMLVLGKDPRELKSVETRFVAADPRVEKTETGISFEGKPIHENLLNTIKRYAREGRDFSNLVHFLERVDENPSENSRRQLFDWAQTKDLTIDEKGFIIGFKGVRQVSTTDPQRFCATNSGGFAVNGVMKIGHYPDFTIGDVITLPREKCVDDPSNACAAGLHVGTHSHAQNYGNVELEVRIDPADVVSVPNHETYKMRCCRYEVIRVHEKRDGKIRETYEPTPVEPEEVAAFVAVIPRTFLDKLLRRKLDSAVS